MWAATALNVHKSERLQLQRWLAAGWSVGRTVISISPHKVVVGGTHIGATKTTNYQIMCDMNVQRRDLGSRPPHIYYVWVSPRNSVQIIFAALARSLIPMNVAICAIIHNPHRMCVFISTVTTDRPTCHRASCRRARERERERELHAVTGSVGVGGDSQCKQFTERTHD